MKKREELKSLSSPELKAAYRDLSKEIFEMKNEIRMTRKLEKPHLLREKKKNRARVLTFLKERGETL